MTMSERQRIRFADLEHDAEVWHENGLVYLEVDGNVASVLVAPLTPNPPPEILTPDAPPAEPAAYGGVE